MFLQLRDLMRAIEATNEATKEVEVEGERKGERQEEGDEDYCTPTKIKISCEKMSVVSGAVRRGF